MEDGFIDCVVFESPLEKNILAIFKKTISNVGENLDVFWKVGIYIQKSLDEVMAFRAILSCLPLDGTCIDHAPFIHMEFSQDSHEVLFSVGASWRALAISTKKGVVSEQHSWRAVYTVRPDARNDAVGIDRETVRNVRSVDPGPGILMGLDPAVRCECAINGTHQKRCCNDSMPQKPLIVLFNQLISLAYIGLFSVLQLVRAEPQGSNVLVCCRLCHSDM